MSSYAGLGRLTGFEVEGLNFCEDFFFIAELGRS